MAKESKSVRSIKKSTGSKSGKSAPKAAATAEKDGKLKKKPAEKEKKVAVTKKGETKTRTPEAPAGKKAPSATASSGKKRLIVSYHNLSPELLDLFKKKYPTGYLEYVMKINAPNDKVYYAVTLDTPDASYLVKVDVKIDTLEDEDFIEPSFAEDDAVAPGVDDAEDFVAGPDEDIENIPSEDE